MRNILSFLIFVSMFLFLAPRPEAQTNVFSFSPKFGFLWGQGEEIVYNVPNDGVNNNHKEISELLWDFKPLWYMGFDFEYGPRYPWERKGFSAGLSLNYGFSSYTGTMEDHDWLAEGVSFLTNYSRHDAYSRGSLPDIFSGTGTFSAGISAGYSWTFRSVFWIKLTGELSYRRYSWMARDGYLQYAEYTMENGYDEWNPDIEKTYIHGKAIAYTQNWVIFSPGFTLGVKLNDDFSLSLLSAFSPLIYGYCRDDHFLREHGGIVFQDYLLGGFHIREELELKFHLNEKLDFSLSAALSNLKGARGDDYSSYKKIDDSFLYEDAGGGGFGFVGFSLGCSYIF